MNQEIITQESAIVENLVLRGDLSALRPPEKVSYYNEICSRLGLDPLTQPFKILRLSGREILYCDRSGAQQLNKLHQVSHQITARETIENCYVVTARAYLPNGRQTESIGAVSLLYPDQTYDKNQKRFVPHPKAGKTFTGDDFCNALMKAETKAKRRSTLDLLGLGMLDESEVGSIPNAKIQPPPVNVTPETPAITAKNDAPKMTAEEIRILKADLEKLLDHPCITSEERMSGLDWIVNLQNAPKFQQAVNKLKTKIADRDKAESDPQSWVCGDCGKKFAGSKQDAIDAGWKARIVTWTDGIREWETKCPACKSITKPKYDPAKIPTDKTPEELRESARNIRHDAQYADHSSSVTRDLEWADELEWQANQIEDRQDQDVAQKAKMEIAEKGLEHLFSYFQIPPEKRGAFLDMAFGVSDFCGKEKRISPEFFEWVNQSAGQLVEEFKKYQE